MFYFNHFFNPFPGNGGMKSGMKRLRCLLILACASIIMILSRPTEAAITTVILIPGNPTTLSNGRAYYLAGMTYTFTQQVIDPAATGWGDITSVLLQIPNATLIEIGFDPASTGAQVITTLNGGVTATASIGAADTWNNFTVTYNVTFPWGMPESVWAAARPIVATASSTLPAPNNLSTTVNVAYGVCSSMRVLNLAMDGEAADGFVNTYHDAFNVTADALVYNVPSAAVADSINTVDPGEIPALGATLMFGAAAYGNATPSPGLTYNVVGGYLSTFSAIPIPMTIRANTATSGNVSTVNSVNIVSNEIQITGITIYNGGGINNLPNYCRSLNVAGTRVQIVVQMRGGGGVMNGNTTVELHDTTNNTITVVTIPSGGTTGTALVTTAGITVAAGNNLSRVYEVNNVYGGVYGSAAGFGQYASNAARINQPANRTIYWDNLDPPVVIAGLLSPSQTMDSITLSWTALVADPIAAVDDFYSYRVYYRTGANPFAVIDRNTNTPTYAALGTRATSSITVTGLPPLTNYDFYMTAVDCFGNESAVTPTIANSTTATDITITVTDGITVYNNASFNPAFYNAATFHPLRQSAIKVTFYIVTGGNLPEQVSLIIADDASEGINIMTLPTGLLAAGNKRIYSCTKIAPNTWSTFIPSTDSLIVVGTRSRFIVETVFSGAPSYSDSTPGEVPPGNPNDQEWRFIITSAPKVTPWPVRILNNVINDKNPVAYPSYYLTDDAKVTITVYDVRGRIVKTLLENARRPGGQNIKEGGWNGRNKAGNKCGVGLYYVYIKAKRLSDGKTVIDEFRKVVIAR
jgi:hypothetical protein